MSIPAMKQMVEALDHGLQYVEVHSSNKRRIQYEKAIELGRQAIAEAEKQRSANEHLEPVAGVVVREGLPTLLRDSDIKPTDKRLYTHPPQRSEDTQPKRAVSETHKWIGLTDEEIEKAYKQAEQNEPYAGAVTRKGIAKVFEQILKEKNT